MFFSAKYGCLPKIPHKNPLLRFLPFLALLDPLSVVPLFLIVSKLMKHFTGKLAASAAMLLFLFLAAGLQGAGVPPEGLCDLQTAFAVHLFPISTFTAQNSTS